MQIGDGSTARPPKYLPKPPWIWEPSYSCSGSKCLICRIRWCVKGGWPTVKNSLNSYFQLSLMQPLAFMRTRAMQLLTAGQYEIHVSRQNANISISYDILRLGSTYTALLVQTSFDSIHLRNSCSTSGDFAVLRYMCCLSLFLSCAVNVQDIVQCNCRSSDVVAVKWLLWKQQAKNYRNGFQPWDVIRSRMLKYSADEYFFRAALCHLAIDRWACIMLEMITKDTWHKNDIIFGMVRLSLNKLKV